MKTIEIRKTRPKLKTPFKVYIYCTKSDGDGCYPSGLYHWLGKVPFEYVCDYIKVIKVLPDRNQYDISADDLKKTHLSQEKLWEYGRGKPLYLWHISDLVIYDQPKELSEFYHYCGDEPKCENCPYLWVESNESVGTYEECSSIMEGYKPLSRPPQSWCYVEEVGCK